MVGRASLGVVQRLHRIGLPRSAAKRSRTVGRMTSPPARHGGGAGTARVVDGIQSGIGFYLHTWSPGEVGQEGDARARDAAWHICTTRGP